MSLGDFAILARTNAQLAPYESLCTEKNIRFHLLGRSGFWTTAEVKNVVRLMDWLLSPRPPSTYSHELLLPIRASVRNTSAQKAVQNIIEFSGLSQMYSNEDYEDDDNFALDNLKRLVQIAAKFSTLSEFRNHAHKAEHASRKSKNALTLSTIHQSKGLEFKHVFVIGVNQGKLPHERGEFEEEARVFYVACSRAAERLRLSFVGTPSVFIQPYLTPEIKASMEANRNKVETLQAQLFA